MGVLTTLLKLLKPGENDYYNQQTEQADNWQKVDDYAVLTNADKNAIWGGLDGGGLIEDPSVTKVVGKRYIGADGKAYICLKPSNINNSTNYAPCNVVDNLDKLQNLIYYGSLGGSDTGVNRKITKLGIFHYCDSATTNGDGEIKLTLPEGWKVLFATTQERDNASYGDTKVWLQYFYGENYVTVRYVDAKAGYTALQCVVFAYKD